MILSFVIIVLQELSKKKKNIKFSKFSNELQKSNSLKLLKIESIAIEYSNYDRHFVERRKVETDKNSKWWKINKITNNKIGENKLYNDTLPISDSLTYCSIDMQNTVYIPLSASILIVSCFQTYLYHKPQRFLPSI